MSEKSPPASEQSSGLSLKEQRERDRQERLAAALRENLRRRKTQAREKNAR